MCVHAHLQSPLLRLQCTACELSMAQLFEAAPQPRALVLLWVLPRQ